MLPLAATSTRSAAWSMLTPTACPLAFTNAAATVAAESSLECFSTGRRTRDCRSAAAPWCGGLLLRQSSMSSEYDRLSVGEDISCAELSSSPGGRQWPGAKRARPAHSPLSRLRAAYAAWVSSARPNSRAQPVGN